MSKFMKLSAILLTSIMLGALHLKQRIHFQMIHSLVLHQINQKKLRLSESVLIS